MVFINYVFNAISNFLIFEYSFNFKKIITFKSQVLKSDFKVISNTI